MSETPPESTFLLVNDDQWEEEKSLNAFRVIPFLERDGQYWGPPASDKTAVRELERLRRAGADYIVFAWCSYWWRGPPFGGWNIMMGFAGICLPIIALCWKTIAFSFSI